MSASTATSPSANTRQVGGRHYKTGGLEHWDLFGPEYLIGCASKYVSRHTQKGGREDLEKALHYCDKLVEVISSKNLTNTLSAWQMLQWTQNTPMGGLEIAICFQLICRGDGSKARQLIEELIQRDYTPVCNHEVTRPGTPEDGGHHARQPPDEGEVIASYDGHDIALQRLPPSLSPHEWQHRCTEDVQQKYEHNVSAARYLVREQHRELCKFCVVDRE